jgi:hypothetical protein
MSPDYVTTILLTSGSIIAILLLVIYIKNMRLAAAKLQAERADDRIEWLERQCNYLGTHLKNVTRRNREAFTGSRVMVRSNEDEPIYFGTILRFEEVSQAKNPLPVIIFEGEEEAGEKLCFAAVMPYNEKLLDEVKGLCPKEQWKKLCHYSIYWE